MSKSKSKSFESGRYVDGLFEFDTTETFYINGFKVQKPGRLDVGVVLKVRGKEYRLQEKYKIGSKLILACDKLESTLDLYTNYQGDQDEDHVPGVYAVEAISRISPGVSQEYLVKMRGRLQWIKAAATSGLQGHELIQS